MKNLVRKKLVVKIWMRLYESEGVDVANDEFREEQNKDNLGDGGVNEEASVNMLDLEKDVDVNYDPGLWGIINDTKRVMLVKKRSH